MAHANEGAGGDRSDLVGRLDHTLQRMRRVVVRPPGVGIPIPGLGRPVDIAKVLACEAIADLSTQVVPVTVTDVAHALQLERSTVSRLLSDCEAENLIQRTPVPGDGRRVGLEVTDDGHAAIAGSTQIRGHFLSHVTQSFTDGDLHSLVDLLERFAEGLSTSLPEWLVATGSGAPMTDQDSNGDSSADTASSDSASASRATS